MSKLIVAAAAVLVLSVFLGIPSTAKVNESLLIQAVLSHQDTGVYQGEREISIGFYTSSDNAAQAVWCQTKTVRFSNGWMSALLSGSSLTTCADGQSVPLINSAVPSVGDIFGSTANSYYIGVTIDGNKVFIPLVSAPYALESRQADHLLQISSKSSFPNSFL